MNCTIATAFKVPYIKKTKGEEPKLSKVLRITGVVLGLLSVVAGALALFNVPGIAQMGSTAAWSLLSVGAASSLLGTTLKGIIKIAPRSFEPPPHLRNLFYTSDETTSSSSESHTSTEVYETEASVMGRLPYKT